MGRLAVAAVALAAMLSAASAAGASDYESNPAIQRFRCIPSPAAARPPQGRRALPRQRA